jgi:pyrimidine operon attenuation protein / uracil phosphoribosyltransferase
MPSPAAPTNLILNATQVRQKAQRMAVEIWERNYDLTEQMAEPALVVLGISGGGYAFAQMLAEELQQQTPLRITLQELVIDKKAPYLAAWPTEDQLQSLAPLHNQSVVVVDDVLNTGRTLLFALAPLARLPLRKLQVAVLVARNHRRYPINADYTGYALATTLTEHVEAVFAPTEQAGVYLS